MAATSQKTDFKKKGMAFGLDMYQALQPSSNIIVSPLSVRLALGMAYMGAAGQTEAEMRKALRIYDDKIESGKAFFHLTCKYAKNENIRIANKIYVNEGRKIKPGMIKAAEKLFSSKVENIDFTEPAAAAVTINKWVEGQTGDKIKDIIDPHSLDPDTVVIVINALYFKCKWQQPFQSDLVKDDFWLNEANSVKVDMMQGVRENLKYAELEDLDCIAIEKSFEDEDFSMLILLPNSKNGLQTLESKLTGLDLPSYRHRLKAKNVMLNMPQFLVSYQADLKGALEKVNGQ